LSKGGEKNYERGILPNTGRSSRNIKNKKEYSL
jgi:hypothetical protein